MDQSQLFPVDGIYVNAFYICRQVDGKPNGAITAYDISTRLVVQSDAPQMPPAVWKCPCMVQFTTDGRKQEYDVSVQSEDTSGSVTQLFAHHIEVSPGNGGGAILANEISFPVSRPGRYWLNLLVDGK